MVAALERLIAADLTHPGIAAPLAAGLEQCAPYLAMDFVAADSFDVVMRDYGPAPVADALRIATQLGGALDFAAAVDVLHGALHPRDVLVTTDDTRVTGIGIAQALEQIGVAAPVRRPYTAPEKLAGSAWDRRADVFSLAALVYEMLFGRRIAGVGRDAAEAITAVEGADSDTLRTLFARALAEDPGERFETALAFADALHGAFTLTAQPARPPRSRRRRDTDGAAAKAASPGRRARPSLPLTPEPDLPLIVATHTPDLPLALPDLPADPAAHAFDAARSAVEQASLAVPSPEAIAPASEPASSPEPLLDEPEAPPDDLELKRAEADRYVLAESTSALPDVRDERFGDIGDPPNQEADVPSVSRREPIAKAAADVPGEPAPTLSSLAIEQSRSAIWPLALALIVGLLVGYAFGYGMGTRDRGATLASIADTSDPSAPPSLAADAPPDAVQADPPLAGGTAGVATPPADPPMRPRPVAEPSRPPTPSARPATAPGRMVVRSNPSGARVSIDGRDVGVTPATLRDLSIGTHVIRIAHQGYVTAERRVRIRTAQPAQSIEVDLAATRPARQAAPPPAPERTSGLPAEAPGAKAGSVMVDSRPAGARVFVDGKMVGTTPLLLDAVAAGDHTVRLELDGFNPWTSAAKVTGGERTRVSGSLEQR